MEAITLLPDLVIKGRLSNGRNYLSSIGSWLNLIPRLSPPADTPSHSNIFAGHSQLQPTEEINMTAFKVKMSRIQSQSFFLSTKSDLARAFQTPSTKLNAAAIQEVSIRVPVVLQWILYAGNLIYNAEFS